MTTANLLQKFSLETTARDASRFLQVRHPIPPGTPVNLAFLDSETFDQRIAAIEMLRTGGCHPRPIMSARRLTSQNVLESFLFRAVEVGQIQGIFLVGGDPSAPRGPFVDSMDLINNPVLDVLPIKTVGIAGYPEGHPRIQDDVLWDYLRRKVDRLMSKAFHVEITTQLSFNADAVVSWIEKVRHAGIDAPIRIGIPTPSRMAEVLKFAMQCRVATSAQILQRLGWNLASVVGSEGPEKFLTTLRQRMSHRDLGVVHLHVFPLGDLSSALQWLHAIDQSWNEGAVTYPT